MLRSAETCQNMTDLRTAIDVLDSRIMTLLAQRARYIDRAVVIKSAANLPARIDVRVEAVVQNARTNATAAGFDPALAETIWRQMIEWSIAREETAMAAQKEESK